MFHCPQLRPLLSSQQINSLCGLSPRRRWRPQGHIEAEGRDEQNWAQGQAKRSVRGFSRERRGQINRNISTIFPGIPGFSLSFHQELSCLRRNALSFFMYSLLASSQGEGRRTYPIIPFLWKSGRKSAVPTKLEGEWERFVRWWLGLWWNLIKGANYEKLWYWCFDVRKHEVVGLDLAIVVEVEPNLFWCCNLWLLLQFPRLYKPFFSVRHIKGCEVEERVCEWESRAIWRWEERKGSELYHFLRDPTLKRADIKKQQPSAILFWHLEGFHHSE